MAKTYTYIYILCIFLILLLDSRQGCLNKKETVFLMKYHKEEYARETQ